MAEAWLGGGSGFLSLPVEAPAILPAALSRPETDGHLPRQPKPAGGEASSRRWQITASLGLSSFWLRSPAVSEVIEARRYRGPVTAEELDGIAPWPGFEGIYFADAEVHRLTLDVRRSLGRRFELGLRTSVVNADGGVLDPLIEGFHDFFGFRQSGRPQTLENQYRLYFRRDGPGGYGDRLRFVRFEQAGTGVGETVISLKSGLAPAAPTWRQAIQVQLKLPTASDEDFLGTGSVDVALQYLVSRPWRRWTLYANAGLSRLGSHDLLTLEPQNVVTISLAGERPTGPRSSMILQLRHQQSPFRQLNLSILGVTATLIDVGWTRALEPTRNGLDRSAFFSITNNTAKYGSAVDISLHAGLRLNASRGKSR